jgi:Ni,Fe-hydrogenase III component G
MCPYYQLEHLLGICPGEVLLDLLVVLYPILWGTTKLISRVVVQACNPTSNDMLSSICYDLSHSDWCEVESQDCFDLHFPDD